MTHSRRILNAIGASVSSDHHHAVTTIGSSNDLISWPHRLELRVTASEKLAGPPLSRGSFPLLGTDSPLQLVRQATGYEVRSVSAADFPSFWRDRFRAILAEKGATAEEEEFWATGASNGRALQWRVLEIPPGSAYPLHAHPGVEVYLVVRGVVHEWRMVGVPLLRATDFDDASTVARVLDLSRQLPGSERKFEARTMQEGDLTLPSPPGTVLLLGPTCDLAVA